MFKRDETVWWKWTTPTSGSVTIDTVGSSFDTQTGIYTGTSLSSLYLEKSDDDSGASMTSVCTFNCTAGTTYYICVGGYPVRTGTITLHWNLTPTVSLSSISISGASSVTSGGNTTYTCTATKTVTVYPAPTLATALDNSKLMFTTGGHSAWLSQSTTTHDGIDAARSGSVSDNQNSWMQTTVMGPGTISFWWRVSSEPGYFDYLEFLVNGVRRDVICGECTWKRCSFFLGPGAHMLTWNYSKDYILSYGLDAGFVDQVEWTPGYLSSIDFNGDWRCDIAVYDPKAANWYSEAFGVAQYGWGSTIPTPADFDGDGKADLAVFNRLDGFWYIHRSSVGGDDCWVPQYGWKAATPVPADYDGDGIADLGIYDLTTGVWYTFGTSEGHRERTFGWRGAVPLSPIYWIHRWFGL